MQRSLQTLNVNTPSISGRFETFHRTNNSRSALKGRQLPQNRTHTCTRPLDRYAVITCAASQQPSLTLKQRLRSAQHDVDQKARELREKFMALPPVAAAIHFLHGVQQFLDPYVRRYQEIRELIGAWWEVREERYREFIGDETKRKWQWQRRNEEELKFWTGIVQAIVGIFVTILWETITPVSFVIAVLPPLWVAWALHGNLFKSPIFYTLVAMCFLKFPIGYPIRWI
ncbi:g11704 [Coccomyxa elongata]